MSEREKIVELIETHKAIIEATDMDVAESMKGQWFFSRYNKEFDYYDTLVRFQTARELAECILGELAVDILGTIDCESEEKPSLQDLADDLEMKADYESDIKRLIDYLG